MTTTLTIAMPGLPVSWARAGRNKGFTFTPKKRADPVNKWRASRPDVDNLWKLVGDGLNGIVWSDDARIAKATASKVYGDTAQTLIEVSPV